MICVRIFATKAQKILAILVNMTKIFCTFVTKIRSKAS